ncbi:hypothetical protein PM082_019868 [Marasmius tenuissimus]|nr:hypothetical protein PM082_019868 [Marasmius tenuissimus]
MPQLKYIVEGAKGGMTEGASAPNRLEINDFVKNEAHFSLYIQALQKLQQKDQSEIDSFFQIGGIHGLPNVKWGSPDDGPETEREIRKPCRGYSDLCHGEVLFPTWNRSYVILIEQAIQREAMEIAKNYTVDAQCFKDAAESLRQPYWDWAKNSVPPPEVISLEQVTIIGFNGERVSVANPLRRYTFDPLKQSFGFPKPFDKWGTTLRHPTDGTENATEDVDGLRKRMAKAQTDIETKTYCMLTRVYTWDNLSNNRAWDDRFVANSLEAIHDCIHVNIGGGGHMDSIDVAAFDPIFWMHHAQIDRLLSLWFSEYPGIWVPWGGIEDPSKEKKDMKNASTPLWPFRSTGSTFWKSEAFEDTGASLGYTYPDFNKPIAEEPTGPLPISIGHKINYLYAGAAFNQSSQKVVQESHATAGTTFRFGPFWDWTARIRVKKYEVGSSFSIPLFVGGRVPDDPKEWLTTENFVGAHHAFVSSVPDSCDDCTKRKDITIEGFVHLSHILAGHKPTESLDSDKVVPYLTTNLHWRAIKGSGEAIELSQLPSLEVTVSAQFLENPRGKQPSEPKRYPQITLGKPGGAKSSEI